MDALRTETIEDVKILADLNKLKLTLVTGATAVAFGLAPNQKSTIHPIIILAIVPLICLFVDCHYYHHLAKIFARASYLRAYRPIAGESHGRYEEYMRLIRSRLSPKLFSFETTAQLGSSLLFSLFIPSIGIVACQFEPMVAMSPGFKTLTTLTLLSSVVLGLIHVLYFYRKYRRSIEALHKGEDEWIAEQKTEANVPNQTQ